MINNMNPEKAQFETPFDYIHDVNEFVLAARAAWMEENEIPAERAPIDEEEAKEAEEDAAMDYLSACLIGWIVMHEQVPIDSKERMTQIIESMINVLRKIQSVLPEDQEELKSGLLQMLRGQYIIRKDAYN
jgi:hypothetical protein